MSGSITYLFGAGASMKSMPLVNNFCERFEGYLKFLNARMIDQGYINKNNVFLQALKSHLSFDTFFKKLFHTNSSSREYKFYLWLFFLYEHITDPALINNFANTGQEKNYSTDPRYDALIAGLLKPIKGKVDFFAKTTFLTWNYDLNLLSALYNFLGNKNEGLDSFLEKHQSAQNIFSFSGSIKVIHLNGYIKSHFCDYMGSQDIVSLTEIFNSLVSEFLTGSKSITKYVSTLNFSWENASDSPEMPNFLVEAIDAVNNSHSIIVTGYSFPLYNRLFDREIIHKKPLNNKILYIKDPLANELSSLISSDFQIPTYNPQRELQYVGTKIVVSTNCDSFLIPPNIY